MRRRHVITRTAAMLAAMFGARLAGASGTQPSSPRFASVSPGRVLRFPRDFGAHPDYRTEWWYVTGWLRVGDRDIGVQVTFFRSRTLHDPRNPSRFAPTQLVLAHAAIAPAGDPALRHAQRAARAGFGLAGFSESDTAASVADWRLERSPDDRYRTRIEADDFALELDFSPGGPPVLQGVNGYSRKGPRPGQASHYYSRPQLVVGGRVRLGDSGNPMRAATGIAWLDHEWSSEYLDPRASGWDWCGLNLDDGSALMAFRIRARDGSELWSDATLIAASHLPAPEQTPAPSPTVAAGRPARAAGPAGPAGPAGSTGSTGSTGPACSSSGARPPTTRRERPRFTALEYWRSLRSGARYPVRMRVEAFGRNFELQPLLDDQELDASTSTGTIYWEGAVRVLENGRAVGRGYLELTGYAGALRM